MTMMMNRWIGWYVAVPIHHHSVAEMPKLHKSSYHWVGKQTHMQYTSLLCLSPTNPVRPSSFLPLHLYINILIVVMNNSFDDLPTRSFDKSCMKIS
jgi:hypothetical protein